MLGGCSDKAMGSKSLFLQSGSAGLAAACFANLCCVFGDGAFTSREARARLLVGEAFIVWEEEEEEGNISQLGEGQRREVNVVLLPRGQRVPGDGTRDHGGQC